MDSLDACSSAETTEVLGCMMGFQGGDEDLGEAVKQPRSFGRSVGGGLAFVLQRAIPPTTCRRA